MFYYRDNTWVEMFYFLSKIGYTPVSAVSIKVGTLFSQKKARKYQSFPFKYKFGYVLFLYPPWCIICHYFIYTYLCNMFFFLVDVLIVCQPECNFKYATVKIPSLFRWIWTSLQQKCKYKQNTCSCSSYDMGCL